MLPLNLFIEVRHAELNLPIAGAHELFTSKTQYTRQINQPQRLTLETLLRLAYRIKVHPLELYKQYGAGKLMITRDDITQLRAHYVIKPHNTLRDVKNHIQSPAPTQDQGANQQSLCVS